MSRRRFTRLSFAAVLLAGLPMSAQSAHPAEDQLTVAQHIELVTWSRIANEPCAFLGREVRLRFQMRARLEHWNPYVTRFGSRDFAAYEGWADEQMPWIAAEYASPRVRLFARHGGDLEHALADARTLQRYEVRAIVREIFRDQAWIEITAAERLPEEISEASAFHAARALEQKAAGNTTLALSEFDQALSAPLPAPAKAELERLRAECAAAVPPPPPKPVIPKARL